MRHLPVVALLALCWAFPASALAADRDERLVVVGPVLVDRGETTGDVVVADGDVTVRGTVDGNVAVADGDVTIRGTVTGDVVTLGGRAVLGRRARVDGDVQYADKAPQVTSGATVGGDVAKLKAGDIGTAVRIGLWIAVTVSALALGLLLVLLFPRAADAVGVTARADALRAALVGLLAFFLIPLLAVAVLFTVVGIPLGVVLLLALAPLFALAYTASAFAVGRLVSAGAARVLAFVIGLAILRALALVPFLGGLVWFLATVFGLGTLLTAARRARA